MSLATSSWPFRIVGRSTIRLGPIIATSGRLITGVVQIPPSGPREVIVSVDPLSSAEVTLPERAASASRLISVARSEEHTSELQSLIRISYAVFCLKKNNKIQEITTNRR